MSDKAAREAFESWFSEEGKWPSAVEQNPDGNYKLCSAHSAWVSWQAGWSSCQGFLDTSVLRAAAPDMYEALQQAITSMQDSGYQNSHVAIRAGKAALAKAEGKS